MRTRKNTDSDWDSKRKSVCLLGRVSTLRLAFSRSCMWDRSTQSSHAHRQSVCAAYTWSPIYPVLIGASLQFRLNRLRTSTPLAPLKKPCVGGESCLSSLPHVLPWTRVVVDPLSVPFVWISWQPKCLSTLFRASNPQWNKSEQFGYWERSLLWTRSNEMCLDKPCMVCQCYLILLVLHDVRCHSLDCLVDMIFLASSGYRNPARIRT